MAASIDYCVAARKTHVALVTGNIPHEKRLPFWNLDNYPLLQCRTIPTQRAATRLSEDAAKDFLREVVLYLVLT